MSGAGLIAAGIGPFGIGTPAYATTPPLPTAGQPIYIDSARGDYQVDPATGELARMPLTRQRVLLAIATSRGSSTVEPDMGIETPTKIDRHFSARMSSSYQRALRRLTADGSVRIDDTQAKTSGSRAMPVLSFTDHYGDPTEDRSEDDGI